MNVWLIFSVNILFLLIGSSANRVIELNEKFLDFIKRDSHRSWLVKFYAPWCHHCRNLEPVYAQVAQTIHPAEPNLLVARVDCTKYTNVATYFSVRGFPTILFVRGTEKIVEYRGDRTRDDLIDFARRLNGPEIRTLSNCNELDELRDRHPVFFFKIGPSLDSDRLNFTGLVRRFHDTVWFYESDKPCQVQVHHENVYEDGESTVSGTITNSITASVPKTLTLNNGFYVVKKHDKIVKFESPKEDDGSLPDETLAEGDGEKKANLTKILSRWIKYQRFPIFSKMSPGSLHLAMQSGKLLVLALVEEHKTVQRLVSSKHEEFRDLMEAIAGRYVNIDPATGHNRYIFGWTSELDTVNSFAIRYISPLPNLIVINTTNLEYWMLKDDESLIAANIIQMLDQIVSPEGSSHRPPQGGNSWPPRIQRMAFDTWNALNTMYKGNPVLTLLLFGLPLGFLSIIIYTSCFSDIFEAKEEEDEEEEDDDQDPLLNRSHENHAKSD